MSVIKRTSVAANLVFLMVDTLDHITGKTGLAPVVTLSKNGSAFAPPTGAVSEIGSGWYMVAGNAADTGTLGTLILHASATGADPYDTLYEVVAFDPQDSIRLGLSALSTGNVVLAEATVQSANKISARAADSWTLPINGLGNIVGRFEKAVLQELYQRHPSSRLLGKRLGVSHTTIANKLREYGIGKEG